MLTTPPPCTTTTRPLNPAPTTGSLSRRMIGVAALWIVILLSIGGVALDRVLVSVVTNSFDTQMTYVLNSMVISAEIGPDGEVFFNKQLNDQRYLEPGSGAYWQVSAPGQETFPSRSLWDQRLAVLPPHEDIQIHFYDSRDLGTTLRVAERDIELPGSAAIWRFQVAEDRALLDQQIAQLRRILVRSFAILALGLVVLAALQTLYGLWPLRRIRESIAAMRAGRIDRVTTALPLEVQPMVTELNALIDHNERQAEEARRHAGNLAHALKTPLTVVLNAAREGSADLAPLVEREAATMRRQVDHHLARARAVGRRGHAHSRAAVWPALQSVERAVGRLHPDVRVDIDGDEDAAVRVERQDLDELLGNLIENAAKYGGGSVFVTVRRDGQAVDIVVEDDGAGIPAADRDRLFDRGARLDTSKPGTGLGLAIVRDVAEIYGGSVALDESEDLGGLAARLRLPAAAG